MGLQAFKKNIADSVVNQQNASLDSMNPDQLLDLFELSPVTAAAPGAAAGRAAPLDEADAAQAAADAAAAAGSKRKARTIATSRSAAPAAGGASALMSSLGELWGAEQYEEEYNLQNFLAGL